MPYTNVNGIMAHYEESGDGFPLLILLPLGCVIDDLRVWIDAFSDIYRVIIADTRGCGKSEESQGPYTIKLIAEDAAALLDCLHIRKAHVIGTSFGGHVAQELALLRPELLEKLVLIFTAARSDDKTQERLKLWRELKTGGHDELYAKLTALSIYDNRFFKDKEGYHKWLKTFINSPGHSSEGYLKLLDAAINFNALDRINNIKCKTLCFYGDEDVCINRSQVEEMVQEIPGARIEMLESAHEMMGESYMEFVRITKEFLGTA